MIIMFIMPRRVCLKCGYSTSADKAPDGKCKECGEPLVIRDDDKREVVENRLKVPGLTNSRAASSAALTTLPAARMPSRSFSLVAII